jgi:rhombotail lipoprotein
MIAALALVTAGCYSNGPSETRRRSSTAEYLYPKDKDLKERPTIPHMELPLNVGIAFVPESNQDKWRTASIDEAVKRDLLEQVAAEFRDLPMVSEIEIIPSAYLRPGGGFRNLDQLSAMHEVDVIALVAFDQIQHSDDGALSITYWTIVGAYVVPGEKNDTSTMLDTAVYHVPSRKMLFRAPGTSQLKGRASLVMVGESLRKDSAEGLAEANEEMIANLKAELDRFKVKVKEQPEKYIVTHSPGYTGGGSLGMGAALLAVGAVAWSARRRRTRS